MEPVGIAASVIAILAPLLKNGAETAAEKLGITLFEKANGLLGMLKSRFRGDKEAENTLESFELNPDRHKDSLRSILDEKLQSDESLARELARLVNEMGPRIEVEQKITELAGEAIVLDIGTMTRGSATATQEIGRVERGGRATGARIESM